uniref:Transmembrane protein n=1 Tax=Medicago truncatula TaxID=3880 RepID=I3SA87_MEDTR|nr:unknown [Medicago truncatula]
MMMGQIQSLILSLINRQLSMLLFTNKMDLKVVMLSCLVLILSVKLLLLKHYMLILVACKLEEESILIIV